MNFMFNTMSDYSRLQKRFFDASTKKRNTQLMSACKNKMAQMRSFILKTEQAWLSALRNDS